MLPLLLPAALARTLKYNLDVDRPILITFRLLFKLLYLTFLKQRLLSKFYPITSQGKQGHKCYIFLTIYNLYPSG